MFRALTGIEVGIPGMILNSIGLIFNPFHSLGANVSKAAGDVIMSMTRGTALRIAGEMCVSSRL